jgi:hypothetical protein
VEDTAFGPNLDRPIRVQICDYERALLRVTEGVDSALPDAERSFANYNFSKLESRILKTDFLLVPLPA